MHKIIRTAFLVSFLFLFAGCTVGKNFVRPSSDTFQLGKTTYSQLTQKMGEPKTVDAAQKNGKDLKRILYTYATTEEEPLEEGVTSVRQLVYIFYNDTLVSQAFISSIKSDNTNFDETKKDGIIKGKTSREEVIRLLGQPAASKIYPITKDPSDTEIGYVYMAARKIPFKGMKFFSKILDITFDNKNIVSDINHEMSGY